MEHDCILPPTSLKRTAGTQDGIRFLFPHILYLSEKPYTQLKQIVSNGEVQVNLETVFLPYRDA